MINAALAARIEAFRLSRLVIKDRLRAEGLRLRDIDTKVVNRSAEVWFADHRAELIDQGLGQCPK
jgi:hypothetical protein